LFFVVANTALDAFIASWKQNASMTPRVPTPGARRPAILRWASILGYLGPGKGFGVIRPEQWHPYHQERS